MISKASKIFNLRLLVVKVHLAPNLFSAEMKLCNIHIKKLIILSVSVIFKGFKN